MSSSRASIVSIGETPAGKFALARLPSHLANQPARKPFPRKGLWRPFWERLSTVRENFSSRSIDVLRRNGAAGGLKFLHLQLLAALYTVSYRDYVILNLGQSILPKLPLGYVTYFRRHRVREFVNNADSEIFLHNKLLFKIYMDHLGFSQSELLISKVNGVYYDKDFNILPDSLSKIKKVSGKKFIIKALNGRYGAQNQIYSSEMCLENEIIAEIEGYEANFPENDYLVEQLIDEDITPYKITNSLNTVRLTTWRRADGKIVVIGAAQRLATKEGAVDNWTSGGLATAINIEDGQVDGRFYSKKLDKFPDVELEQRFHVPNWEEIKALVTQAHEQFVGMRSIGWDVANVSPHPIIIEGNHDWDTYIHQRTSLTGFGELS